MRNVGYGCWRKHVRGATPMLRGWLTDTASLTRKLSVRCKTFRVRQTRQASGTCFADEFSLLHLPRRSRALEREVLLECDSQPLIFAHTVVPGQRTAASWPFLGALGERSLGTKLFADPLIVRGELQFARLTAQHPLVRRAFAALGPTHRSLPPLRRLYARRCLFARKGGLLLVTELFLPRFADWAREREKPLQAKL